MCGGAVALGSGSGSGSQLTPHSSLIRGWEGLARQWRPGLARAGYLVITGYKVCQGERERERAREREGKSEMLKSASFWWRWEAGNISNA